MIEGILRRGQTPARPGPGPMPEPLLRALDLTIARRVDGLLPGDHRSSLLGRGSELAQIRPYEPVEDDVRQIDWNVTARTGIPHVRIHLAERALVTWLALDTSASMMFGTGERRKADVAEGASLAIGYAGNPANDAPLNYLNDGYGLKSWLLTRDHKRIALLYLAGVTFFFFLGGAFAVMIRLELATPAGDLMSDDTYNKMFTMHGVMMVFFFLIPAIPGALGNFLIPIMIGAKDLAFPKLNLASWYIMMLGASFTTYAVVTGGLDTGWTFYTPFSTV